MSNKNKAIISTCAASVVGMIALVTTAVLAYIIQDYASQGVAVATIVSMMTIQPLVGVFMAFIVGPISMRVSKKLILMFALLLVIINGVIFSIFGGNCSIYWLLFASALTGIVSGVISTVPNSIVSEYAESWDERGKFTGWNNAFMQGGALIMSAVGGILGATRWQNAYYLYFLAVPALLIVAILCPMDHPAADKANTQKLDFGKIPGKVWLMCVHYVIFFICCYTFSVYISSYIITDFALGTSAQSGLAAALLTISAVLAATFYSNYNKKLGKWFMPFFCLTMGIGYLLCSTLTTTLAGCMIGAFLIGIGKSAVVPYVIGEATSRAPRYMTPMIISLIMGSMSLGMFLSKYVTGWMCNFLGGETTYNRFVSTTIICVVAIILGFLIYTLDKKPETETAKAKA